MTGVHSVALWQVEFAVIPSMPLSQHQLGWAQCLSTIDIAELFTHCLQRRMYFLTCQKLLVVRSVVETGMLDFTESIPTLKDRT